MSKKMTKRLANAVTVTATAIQAGKSFNESPLLGGGGSGGTAGGARNALLNIQNGPLGGAAVVLVQGHDSTDSVAPASGDAGWYTLATLNAASPAEQEIEIAPWMRTNVTTLGTGTMTIDVVGVQ